MDELFGAKNFSALIPFKTTSSVGSVKLDSINDYLLWYSKDHEKMKYRQLYTEVGHDTYAFPFIEFENNTSKRMSAEDKRTLKPGRGRLFRTDNLTSRVEAHQLRSPWKSMVASIGLQRMRSGRLIRKAWNNCVELGD